jgi:DNA topoisomerase-1
VPRLVYVDDSGRGYSRRRHGAGFSYLDTHGHTITNATTIARLKALAVPPAWTEVWLCPNPRGHIQATGRDARGRKQYRYHVDWQRQRDDAKYDSLVDFGHALPILRERVNTDMARRDLSHDKVVATTIWLLDHTLIRVGNAEYSRDSYGLTTLLDRHVRIEADSLRFRFTGKSGSAHDVSLSDRRVARIVGQCQDLPGQHLLQYLAGERVAPIGSRDVNDYIKEVTHSGFTAKTFRTWGGSVLALHYLNQLPAPESETAAAHEIVAAVKATAERLRNTAAVCRSSYIHPRVLEAYSSGDLAAHRRRRAGERHLLDEDERRLLGLLDA